MHPPSVMRTVNRGGRPAQRDEFAAQDDHVAIDDGIDDMLANIQDYPPVDEPVPISNAYAVTQRNKYNIPVAQRSDGTLVIENIGWLDAYQAASGGITFATNNEQRRQKIEADTTWIFGRRVAKPEDEDGKVDFKNGGLPIILTPGKLAEWTFSAIGKGAASINPLLYLERFLQPQMDKVFPVTDTCPGYKFRPVGDLEPVKLKLTMTLDSNGIVAEGESYIATQCQFIDLYGLGFRLEKVGGTEHDGTYRVFKKRYELKFPDRDTIVKIHAALSSARTKWSKFFIFTCKRKSR